MSKVYIVTYGDYSDYHICAASLDKKRAELLAEKYTDGYDEATVEEYELDEFFEEAKHGYSWYWCWCKIENGMFGQVKVRQLDSYGTGMVGKVVKSLRYEQLFVDVLAENDEHAQKIAAEKFATYIYEHAGEGEDDG